MIKKTKYINSIKIISFNGSDWIFLYKYRHYLEIFNYKININYNKLKKFK